MMKKSVLILLLGVSSICNIYSHELEIKNNDIYFDLNKNESIHIMA